MDGGAARRYHAEHREARAAQAAKERAYLDAFEHAAIADQGKQYAAPAPAAPWPDEGDDAAVPVAAVAPTPIAPAAVAAPVAAPVPASAPAKPQQSPQPQQKQQPKHNGRR